MSFLPPPEGSEIADDTKFGGLAFDDKGVWMRTARWTDRGIAIPQSMNSFPYAAQLVAHHAAVHVAGSSVGRIKFIGVDALLSGWISAVGQDRFFISSTHNLPSYGTLTEALVCFDSVWEGEQTLVAQVFKVSFQDQLGTADLAVWKFNVADVAALPTPLTFGVTMQVNNPIVAIGFCCVPTQDKLDNYYDVMTDPAKAKATRPDVATAIAIYHPNQKVVSPGVAIVRDVRKGYAMWGVRNSMYHGMSGGPIISVAAGGTLAVSGQVIGNTETIMMNCNTVLDITVEPVLSFLRQYMS